MKLAWGFLIAAALFAQEPSGLYNAAVTANGREVPFRMEFQGKGAKLRGAIIDGDNKIWSTSGSCGSNHLELKWDFYDSELKADWKDGAWKGTYTRRTRRGLVPREFTARPYSPPPAPETTPASFAGDWVLEEANDSRGKAMTARFRQSGDRVTGTIQRIDGDFGTLEGLASGQSMKLSHFDGIRATLLEATMRSDGTMEGIIGGSTKFRGARADAALKLGFATPPDPSRYSGVKDPSQPFRFKFQDLDGNWVSTEDPKLKGKVVLVTIMGSWCPNCHDEAPFLAELYRKYNKQGLEVVSLAFEYTGEVERDRAQVKAFQRLHNLPYTMLLAGTTEEGDLQKKLPQLADFGAYPTTLILGRDGRVRSVHAGFAGPATGEEHTRLKAETEQLVQQLLKER